MSGGDVHDWARSAADDVVAHARRSTPTLGLNRLVCVDGPAGSGKTTLASAISEAWRAGTPRLQPAQVRVLHMDDLYPGWQGLRAGIAKVTDSVVGPLARGEVGGYRRHDWLARIEAEWVEVAPVDLLVLEGCGSGSATYAESITTLAWVEVPTPVRLRRGVARDGVELRDHWMRWMVEEGRLFAEDRTRERADLCFTGQDVSDGAHGSDGPG
ncbi:MAG: 4-amino-4-deoxy-L-arabinose transferase [Nocardioides sp.]